MKKGKRECGLAMEMLKDLKKDKNVLIKMLSISLIANVIAVIGILRK
ncbi:MAG: hypothetical protein OSJ66_08785 [Clostridia bacterium]|nr:hypothetical protein [Clostridia bacterium]